MCRKILWCYVLVLSLLDISLNTKLTAQGKSHGVTLHDSLIEGISFQEWGAEAEAEGERDGAAPAGVRLEPASLQFGEAELARPHVRAVTLTNTGNTTLHLASVAGTTPDFHASFFESKTLAPRDNTTFKVVYLGRREGPAAAHLYVHTSLGVHKYPVSAVGVANEYDVWPLVGVRVPLNATVEPVLTLYNPTSQTIQVREVYSSGAWLGLELPAGGASAPRAAWAVPPRATRDIVRLRVAPPPPPPSHAAHPLTAYVRLKANIPGGSLVVCVEARGAAAGEHARPLQLRLRTRGSRDPPLTVRISGANSGGSPVRLDASVRTRCDPALAPAPAPPASAGAYAASAFAPRDLCAAPAPPDRRANGASGAGGAHLSLLRPQLEPHHDFTEVAQLTLDFGELWASALPSAEANGNGGGDGVAGGGGGGVGGAWCAGCVRLGHATLPYSVRLLPGTLRMDPPELHWVTAGALQRELELRAYNEFGVPVHLAALDLPPEAQPYFEVVELTPLTLAAGEGGAAARLRLRDAALGPQFVLDARAVLRTNLSHYEVPLRVYSGRLDIEWEWPNSAGGALRLGALSTSGTRRVGFRVRNAAPVRLCAAALSAELPGGSAQLALAACAPLQHVPPGHACRCVEGGGAAAGWLVAVAPARAGALRGRVLLATDHARTAHALELRAAHGRLLARTHPRPLPLAAPYAWSSAELVLENSMELEMHIVEVTQPTVDPSLHFIAGEGGAALRAGAQTVGALQYRPERRCEPACYTGLDVRTPEGVAWLARGAACEAGAGAGASALRPDLELLLQRLQRFEREDATRNLTLHVHTNEVVRVEVWSSVGVHWPRLVGGAAGSGALGARAAVGGEAPLRLLARNPSHSHELLLQPVIAAPLPLPQRAGGGAGGEASCGNSSCVWRADSFALSGWRATKGLVREWAGAAGCGGGPLLLLAPGAELELAITFAPRSPDPLAAYLYLRNNLTILEGVLLSGQGAYPSFELGGRNPGSTAPILFEVTECGGAGAVRRTVVARNTGLVGVRLREWRVAGRPCAARGFRLRPCAPLALAPNESRALHLDFTPDYTLARVAARLQLLSELGTAEFLLAASAPARLLPRCAAAAPPPPFDHTLRTASALLAIFALGLVLGTAGIDAERLLRRARAARALATPRAPLDLRALPPDAPSAPPAGARPVPPVRRRRPAKRPLPLLDPQAERRAFERWRADVLRRADGDDERSSDEADVDGDGEGGGGGGAEEGRRCEDDATERLADIDAFAPHHVDTPHSDRCEIADDLEDRPSNSGEEDAVSTSSGSSSPPEEPERRSEPDDGDASVVAPREPADDGPKAETTAPDEASLPVSKSCLRAARPQRDGTLTSHYNHSRDKDETLSRLRPTPTKHHARKDRTSSKRRGERTPPTPPPPPPRDSPPQSAGEPLESGESRAAAPGVRWGASWSSVVAARGAALAPIGSDVRRRAEPPLPAQPTPLTPPAPAAPPVPPAPKQDNSLFYFNGETHATAPHAEPEFPWRPPPPVERPAFSPAPRDYLEEGSGGTGGYGGLGSVWGGAQSTWLWEGLGAVRPPPGFGPPRPPRAYDPFRSLASIWAPGAADWRLDAPETEPPHRPPPPRD